VDVAVMPITRPVFILGCARSGTSILGEAVAASPRVTYLYEVSAIWNRVFPDRPDHRLTGADASPEACRRLREELGARLVDPARDVLVEKNPKHTLRIPLLDAVFPDCRIVHLIRDGRDTVASLMFRNRGPEWGHLKIPGWADILRRYPAENHIRCAHQWRDSVRIAREDARSLPPDRYFEVRYEDLVRDPEAAVEDVFRFLGLEMTAEVRSFVPRIQDATADSYHAKRQVRHYVDNHAVRVGRWRENLIQQQVEEVLAVCGDLLRELGYGDE
jgi:omega-hydroxy-beta-dihydromenaquinone-9 sulfotransferase